MAGPFVDRFRAVVEPLFGRRFTDADSVPEGELDAIQSRAGYEWPEALRDFYTVVGRTEAVMAAHNRFYSPGRFSRMDGKVVFCEENQVVLYWGYDEDQGWRSDPQVYQGINNDEVEWYLESEKCSDFLTGMVYWQALFGGLPHVRYAQAPESIQEIEVGWPLVWKDGDSELFSQRSCIYCLTKKDRIIKVDAAELIESDLEGLGRDLGVHWNHL